MAYIYTQANTKHPDSPDSRAGATQALCTVAPAALTRNSVSKVPRRDPMVSRTVLNRVLKNAARSPVRIQFILQHNLTRNNCSGL